jgi:hypothetical protein
MSSSFRDPSLHPFATSHNHSQEDQAIQQDDGCISGERSEQPSYPALILADDKGDETEKEQQPQGTREDGEQGSCDSDTSSNGDVDDEESYPQDSDQNEGLPPAIRRSRKLRFQHFDDGVSTTRSLQQQHQEIGEEKDQEGHDSDSIGDSHSGSDHSRSDHDQKDDQDSDDSEGPRPAKRRRPSPSNSDPTSNRSQKRRLQQPSERRSRSPSKLGRSYKALPQTQLSLSVNSNNCAQSQQSYTHSLRDDEQMSTAAEYREWPMHGFFKRTTIGTKYGTVWTSA